MKETAGQPAESEIRMRLTVDVQRLDNEAVIPIQAQPSDAGYDLCAVESYVIDAGQREFFRTGIAVAIPEGHVGYIKPRSGLAAKYGIDVLGGVIDSGYRGEVGVILLNTDSHHSYAVTAGDRIAQLVIQPVVSVAFREVLDLTPSERGVGGFGSTGVN
ncbi:deoxyuridine triphosphatase [Arthrobacter phage Pureglobe5]|nr:deoxyuridine triphosphatase [Arthrobacter phage Pureglobe5]